MVVRRTFAREQAEAWDEGMLDYVEKNGFFDTYSGPADDFFGALQGSRPEIYPIYWSHGQMEARQHPHMHAVQTFLNSLWTSESDGTRWFEPERNSIYPTGFAADRPVPTPAGSAIISIPARSTCG